ncbi:unnamed protein product [marine sediment metagenome]|uniref:Uncharacterized protein n=1 Tax=marine sediment metagenome TaxID=412755 RepID=X1TUL7_9ZZZZ
MVNPFQETLNELVTKISQPLCLPAHFLLGKFYRFAKAYNPGDILCTGPPPPLLLPSVHKGG